MSTRSSGGADLRPTVSLVVPTHARPARLAACVSAIARSEYPLERLEIVVVDDGSPTPVDSSSLDAQGVALRVLRQRQAGPGSARNAGVAAADGEIVAFVDDDCEPDVEWLARLTSHLPPSRRALVGGRTLNALETNAFAETSQALISFLYEYYGWRRPEHMFFTTNNLAVRRAHFLELGGFDTRFSRAAGEDREFCARCTRARFQLAYEPQALMYHAHDLGPRSFWRQQLAYGREAYTFRSLQARGGRLRVERLSFYARLIDHPRAAGMRAPLRTSGLLAVSQLANAAGFALEAFGQRARRPRGKS